MTVAEADVHHLSLSEFRRVFAPKRVEGPAFRDFDLCIELRIHRHWKLSHHLVLKGHDFSRAVTETGKSRALEVAEKGRMKSESGKRKKQGLRPDSFC